MPISVAKMAANSARVTFQYQGESVTIEYYPDKITDEMIAKLDGNVASQTQALSEIIKSWDVYEDVEETTMLPLDPEHLKTLGWPFRARLRQEIIQDMRPNAVAPQTPN